MYLSSVFALILRLNCALKSVSSYCKTFHLLPCPLFNDILQHPVICNFKPHASVYMLQFIIHMHNPYSWAFRHRWHGVHYTHMHPGERSQRRGTWAARSALMSCQIKDYQGAPLKLTAALFHFLLPPSAVCETCLRDSFKSLTGEGTMGWGEWGEGWRVGKVKTRQLQGGRERKV